MLRYYEYIGETKLCLSIQICKESLCIIQSSLYGLHFTVGDKLTVYDKLYSCNITCDLRAEVWRPPD